MEPRSTLVRWRQWQGPGIEHLVLRLDSGGISAESVAISADHAPFAVHYRISCDPDWRAREVEVGIVGGGRFRLETDGIGNWSKDGVAIRDLTGALDPDLTVTPFTNTLPIRRLRLKPGESAEIAAAFIELPELTTVKSPQRYTCLDEGRRYLYESLKSGFRREIEVDQEGLVTTYPDFWQRI
ncbi:MAG: hypothetical protein EOS65_20045 [Mesorhizobium sp.]|uniref:putative glycolipid-binding domain-containing protein n=1 Tax=Mesorhizobium sp. TaxID=1871066 RepID=UPI000FD27754|nr:putative glycolipid-binding domain-containing protein [Mesorhizobium sp.]RVC57478.1 hypothetical protein EN779_21665 [Mesorhizobium sp. M4B.F.Ca.ET.088.02.2.1]RWC93908.1 MAG: hypothetical protein EOS32_19500 [Mesorhizobium sp.]RWF25729.1 MAG: hypothetical protein EOS45_29990 [Mesorhizobium sp.]RWF39264.1 MAG: hypothetical protein EOS65_20045 [Mesorhizobium sp.]TIX17473.1 MAG: hypothetical protein E5V41_10450 [Mesorhizobium sp.]